MSFMQIVLLRLVYVMQSSQSKKGLVLNFEGQNWQLPIRPLHGSSLWCSAVRERGIRHYDTSLFRCFFSRDNDFIYIVLALSI